MILGCNVYFKKRGENMKVETVKKVPEDSGWCCWGGKKGFPTFAVVILVIGVSWLLNDLNIFSFKIPWFPLVLIILVLGWIVDHYRRK